MQKKPPDAKGLPKHLRVRSSEDKLEDWLTYILSRWLKYFIILVAILAAIGLLIGLLSPNRSGVL